MAHTPQRGRHDDHSPLAWAKRVFLTAWNAVKQHASDPVTAPGRADVPAGHPLPGAPGRPLRPGPGPRWAAVRASALAAGASAAGLALAGIAAAVLLLWIASPYPDSSLSGALHIAAGLWLLAQGAELVRTATLSGDPQPVSVVPLLLTALPAWLLFRGTASAVASALGPAGPEDDGGHHHTVTGHRHTVTGRPRTRGTARRTGRTPAARRTPDQAVRRPAGADHTVDPRSAAAVAGWVLAGYLTPAALSVVYTARGTLYVDPFSALRVALFAICAAGYGAWAGAGRPGAQALPELLGGRWRAAARRWVGAHRAGLDEAGGALRCAGIGLGLLLAGGALVGAAALAWHADGVAQGFLRLGAAPTGRLAVLLLAAGLVPNLVVWAASYALGAGFTVGAGSVVAPSGAAGYGLLPTFPLLAALPGQGSPWIGWAALAVPALAALGVAWYAGNGGWSVGGTARAVLGAALAEGVAVAVLAAWAGGALGGHRLAAFGPLWWRAGAAACGWALCAVPVAALLGFRVAHPLGPWRALLASLRPRRRTPRAEGPPAAAAADGKRRLLRWGRPSRPGRLRLRRGASTETVGVPERTAPPPEGTVEQVSWPAPAPLPLFPPPLPDPPPSSSSASEG